MPKNIWILIVQLLFDYIDRAIRSLSSIFVHQKFLKSPKDYSVAHELISVGPESFARSPRSIRLGRALFVPLFLISHLYDRKTESPK